MKFLIFGGTGFIGASLHNYIKENGAEAITTSRSGASGSLDLDIREVSEFKKIDFQPDVIVNCASQVPTGKNNSVDTEFIKNLFATNVVGAVNIANWAVSNKVKKIINCSSLAVTKKPWPVPLLESTTNLPDGPHVGYGMSKLCQEKLMDQAIAFSDTKLIHLRLSAVYGASMEHSGIIFHLLNSFQKNEAITLTNADKTEFDFIHVKDVCKVIYKISEEATENDLINLASGVPISLMELAVLLKELTKSTSKIYNTNTDKEVSKAVVSVVRLEKYLGSLRKSFIPMDKGMKSFINSISI